MAEITEDMIERAARALRDDKANRIDTWRVPEWENTSHGDRLVYLGQARAALAAAGVAPQEQLSDDDLLKKYTSAVDGAMKAAHARDGFASNMSRESIVAGLRAVTLAAPVAVDEAKLAEVINEALDAWQGEEPSEVFVAHAIAEYLRGDRA